MTYYMYIESGCAFEAESEEDAREQANAWYIEQLLSSGVTAIQAVFKVSLLRAS